MGEESNDVLEIKKKNNVGEENNDLSIRRKGTCSDGAVDTTVKEPDNMGKMHILASTTVTSTKATASIEKQTYAFTKDRAADITAKEPHNMEKDISASTTITSTTISSTKTAASTENKQTTIVEIQHDDFEHFQWHLKRGDHVIESNALENGSGRFDKKNEPQIFKTKEFPLSAEFEKCLHRHGAEFLSCLPFEEYTHPSKGSFNLAIHLPEISKKPNMEPKSYIVYGFAQELRRGDSITMLHCDMFDAVNILTYFGEVLLKPEQLAAIKELKKKYKD
ncbi:hypothetical protein M0R45_036044 [Rubus argutus]|uniref:Uncharacterized protein n=1 Tax=Rubus argutus TaxID=59490 RepID=A0AAW1VZG4_RUBAR